MLGYSRFCADAVLASPVGACRQRTPGRLRPFWPSGCPGVSGMLRGASGNAVGPLVALRYE